MHLVQILLPLYDNENRLFPQSEFEAVRKELTEAFGGLTAFVRSPAEGLWKEDEGEVSRDDVVMFEVELDPLQREWWAHYRKDLERRFKQDELVVRAIEIEKL